MKSLFCTLTHVVVVCNLHPNDVAGLKSSANIFGQHCCGYYRTLTMILLLRRWSGFAFIVSCRCWYSTVVGSLPGHPTLRIPQRTPVSDDDNTSNTINNNTNSNNHTTTGTSDTPVQIPNESIGEDSRSDDNNNHSGEVATKPETYDDAPIHIPDNEWDGKKSQYTAIAKASPCLCQPVAFELAVDLSLTVGQCGPEAPNTDSFEPDKPRAPAVEKKCTTKPYPFSFIPSIGFCDHPRT